MAVKGKLNPNNRKECFELLGYDFLLDEDFRVWLLEINSNPGLDTTCKLLQNLFPAMMKDIMHLFVFPYSS